jgi:hypothetical protein
VAEIRNLGSPDGVFPVVGVCVTVAVNTSSSAVDSSQPEFASERHRLCLTNTESDPLLVSKTSCRFLLEDKVPAGKDSFNLSAVDVRATAYQRI